MSSETFDTIVNYLAAGAAAVIIFVAIKTLRRIYRKIKRIFKV